jgi:NADP-dependent 3-hydroxy acid dehydrogenase YdfG
MSILKEGNTAVITGASSGIGRATALTCAQKGMNVWMVDVDKEELEAAKELVLQKRLNETSQVRTSNVYSSTRTVEGASKN